jgi:hypothetical protein
LSVLIVAPGMLTAAMAYVRPRARLAARGLGRQRGFAFSPSDPPFGFPPRDGGDGRGRLMLTSSSNAFLPAHSADRLRRRDSRLSVAPFWRWRVILDETKSKWNPVRREDRRSRQRPRQTPWEATPKRTRRPHVLLVQKCLPAFRMNFCRRLHSARRI